MHFILDIIIVLVIDGANKQAHLVVNEMLNSFLIVATRSIKYSKRETKPTPSQPVSFVA